MVHKYADGTCCISSRGTSLPGRYDCDATARRAIRLPFNTLCTLRDRINSSEGRPITSADLDAVKVAA